MLLICYGTRPEYIKVKSLIENLQNTVTLFTGQHTTLIGEHHPTYSLEIESSSGNRLNNIICSVLKHNIFKDINYVLVQGDTTSAMAIALSAFNYGIKIIHLEAGLRTYQLDDPFPEEMNRQLISRMATIHLCPTEFNKENLIGERISPNNIYVTGNTGLDNIDKIGCEYKNTVVVTLHRRDNLPMMDAWFSEINKAAINHPELTFIFPMHPNPDIQKHRSLLRNPNIEIIQPVGHEEMISLMKNCNFLISDSGGIQEEASFLNKCVIVCRRTTERPETIGTHSTMCPYPDKLVENVNNLCDNYKVDQPCPYGNGMAWTKIKDIFHNLKVI